MIGAGQSIAQEGYQTERAAKTFMFQGGADVLCSEKGTESLTGAPCVVGCPVICENECTNREIHHHAIP